MRKKDKLISVWFPCLEKREGYREGRRGEEGAGDEKQVKEDTRRKRGRGRCRKRRKTKKNRKYISR